MPIEPVKIPQNVYIEDRIIGPITLRHIIMLMIGGGVSYVLMTILRKAGQTDIISTVLAWTPLAITVAFAFVRIQEISLLRFCFLLCERTQKPKIRYWQPRTGIVLNTEKLVRKSYVKEEQTATTTAEQTSIKQLSSILDSGPLTQEISTEQKVERDSLPTIDTIAEDQQDQHRGAHSSIVRDILPPPARHA